MKKILFLTSLLLASLVTAPTYAHLAPEIEILTKKIHHLRKAGLREKSLLKVSSNELIKDIQTIDNLLDGTTSNIQSETACPQTRLKALATLFQQEIVGRSLKNKYYYHTKKEPENFFFKRKVRSWEEGKNNNEVSHLKALHVMRIGVKALTKDPLLCFRIPELLKIVSSKIKEESFSSLLTQKAFNILFPTGLFEAIAPYGTYVVDCDKINIPLRMGMAYSNIIISKENNFLVQKGEYYKYNFFSPQESSFTVNLQQSNHSSSAVSLFKVFDASLLMDEQTDFWELAGFDFWQVDKYIYPKKNTDTMKITAAILAQENPFQLFLETELCAPRTPSFHLLRSSEAGYQAAKGYIRRQYKGEQFSQTDLINHMQHFQRMFPQKIKNKDFARFLDFLKNFLLFNQTNRNSKDEQEDAFNIFLNFFETDGIILREGKFILTDTFQKAAAERCNSDENTWRYLTSHPLKQPTYSLENYESISTPYLHLLSNPVFRDEEYFLSSFLQIAKMNFNRLPNEAGNSLNKFYQALCNIKSELSVYQKLYNYLLVLSVAKNYLKAQTGFKDPVTDWLGIYSHGVENLKEGKVELPEDNFPQALKEYFKNKNLQEVQPFPYYFTPLKKEHIEALGQPALTGHRAADKDFFIKDLLCKNDDRTILNGISWYEAVFQAIKYHREKPKTLQDLKEGGLNYGRMFEKLFNEGWVIPNQPE